MYWYFADNGNFGRKVTTVQELKKKIIEGLEIGVTVPVKIESSRVRDHFGDYYGLAGYSNELTNQAIRTFEENKVVIEQIVQGAGVNQENFILYPLMISVDTELYNLL